MKTPGLLALIVAFLVTGCCTALTIEKAKGASDSNQKPQPAMYALVPAAIAGDILLVPYWVVVIIAVNTGLCEAPF